MIFFVQNKSIVPFANRFDFFSLHRRAQWDEQIVFPFRISSILVGIHLRKFRSEYHDLFHWMNIVVVAMQNIPIEVIRIADEFDENPFEEDWWSSSNLHRSVLIGRRRNFRWKHRRVALIGRWPILSPSDLLRLRCWPPQSLLSSIVYFSIPSSPLALALLSVWIFIDDHLKGFSSFTHGQFTWFEFSDCKISS